MEIPIEKCCAETVNAQCRKLCFSHRRCKTPRCLSADLSTDTSSIATGKTTDGELSSLKDKGCSAKCKYRTRIFSSGKRRRNCLAGLWASAGTTHDHPFTTRPPLRGAALPRAARSPHPQTCPPPPHHPREASALSSTSARGHHPGFAPREPSGNRNQLGTQNNTL